MYAIAPNTLDAIAAAGFSVYQNPDPRWQSYAYFTDGQNVGYCQNSRFGGLTLSTCHVPCRECGTGFGMGEASDLTREALSVAFVRCPDWASATDRAAVRKWSDVAKFLAGQKVERVRIGALEVEFQRKAIFRAEPMLSDFIACALQDLGLTEQDEACTDDREARDSGTIYTLEATSFQKLRDIVSAFRVECADHIAAALHLEPGEDGLRHRGDRGHLSLEGLGSTLWLAITGSGVGFTDDGDAPCLEAMADWAASHSVEGLSFDDSGEVYA
jgi:hypothetical protein